MFHSLSSYYSSFLDVSSDTNHARFHPAHIAQIAAQTIVKLVVGSPIINITDNAAQNNMQPKYAHILLSFEKRAVVVSRPSVNVMDFAYHSSMT